MSIIGNAIMIGGGGPILRTVYGAAGETITYGGGTIVLESNGTKQISLPNGSYQFTGGTSGYTTGTITVDSNTTAIYVRPVGTIYWYGAWGENVQSTYSSDPGPVNNSDYFKWAFPQNGVWHALYTSNAGAGYTACTLKYRGFYGTAYVKLGYGDGSTTSGATVSGNFVAYSTTNWSTITLSFTPDNSGKTIRIFGEEYSNRGYYLDVQEWYLGTR